MGDGAPYKQHTDRHPPREQGQKSTGWKRRNTRPQGLQRRDWVTVGAPPRPFLQVCDRLFALGIVALTATITTTAFRGVALQKGCLFYPSVCEMKKEFGNLKPLAEKLRSTLKRQMNEIGWLKLPSQLSKTRDHYIELEYLLEKLINKTDILDHLKLSETQSDIPITNSSDWILDHSIAYVVGVFASAFEFLGLYKLFVKKTISTLIKALSAAGFVIGIGFSVYDLYTQITEEKRVRDELIKQITAIKLPIKEMKQKMALIKSFKSKYIKQIVKPLQTILGYFPPDLFPAFRVYLKKLHNPVNIKYTYTCHMNTHLEHIIAYIKKKLITIRHEIKRREMLRTVYTEIETSITKSQPPLEILIKIENLYKNNNLSSEFNSQFELLRFLAVNFTTNTSSCYWGFRIDLIRNGQLDETNYTSVPLCRSPELVDYDREISTKVNETMAPCRILRQLRDNVFDSMYKLLRYIADYILPNIGCYWGYDLTYIRNTTLHSPVFETMKVDAATFLYTDVALSVLKEPEYNGLCKNHSICEERWQNFLYCSVYPMVVQNKDKCGGEELSGCRDMASVYVKDGFCY
ncbi:uncharacterized protein [Argopecten irradians]|uniref:uncharacterized protein isoform X2 n=1 Tax=Argopecten irradians TaxID=31199 RepID=UPI0037127099